MALNAGVVGPDVVHSRGIQGVAARGMLHMLASWAVASFAAHIPLRHLFGVDVVIDRVAAIACRTCGPLHIVRRIKWRPPVGSIGHEIWPPNTVGDIPLGRFRKIVVSLFREVTLLPNAPVNQGDLVLSESSNVVCRKIGNDGVSKFARIANDICHRRLSPAVVDLGMTLLARFRADVLSGTCSDSLPRLFFPGLLAQAADKKD